MSNVKIFGIGLPVPARKYLYGPGRPMSADWPA